MYSTSTQIHGTAQVVIQPQAGELSGFRISVADCLLLRSLIYRLLIYKLLIYTFCHKFILTGTIILKTTYWKCLYCETHLYTAQSHVYLLFCLFGHLVALDHRGVGGVGRAGDVEALEALGALGRGGCWGVLVVGGVGEDLGKAELALISFNPTTHPPGKVYFPTFLSES